MQASIYDICKILSITGGVPWYLEQIQSKKTVDQSIKQLCFYPSGLFVEEFRLIFHDLFEKRGSIYTKIVRVLANGMRDYAQLREEVGYDHGGTLSPFLDALIISGYVKEHRSWSIKTRKMGKKNLFRLSDNYVRFYLKVLEPQLEAIKRNAFENTPLSSISGWASLMGLQMENMVLNHRRLILDALGIYPQDIVVDNPYHQRPTNKHLGLQIDYLIQVRTNTLYLCEFKTTQSEIRGDVIREIQEKMDRLSIPRRHAVCPILIHLGDVSESVRDSGFFYRIIDMGSFLN